MSADQFGEEMGTADSSGAARGSAFIREGLMDVQLSLPAHFMPVAQPIASIIKRDGRRMPFNTLKIADAIARAAKSIDEEDFDRAESFASAVALSLAAQLSSVTPTVDHVHDAVERVLIEMGYHRIALAYVRYRDRRGRMRELRGEDAHSIQEALTDARRDRDSMSREGMRHRFVHTSRDTITHWGREHIVETLVRETGLDSDTAERIAREVEAQVQRARLTFVTATIVRELVGAKLIEYGLEEHHRRHARLGVPLFDVDTLLTNPHSEAISDVHDPATTDTLIARRVKREYALTHVFSAEIADAHVRGDVHLHGLEQVDRLESLSLSLEFLKRFGLITAEGKLVSRPARRSDALIGQLGRLTEGLQRCVSERVEWKSINVHMAPYMVELDRYILQDTAHELLMEFVYRDLSSGVDAPRIRLEMVWDMPSHLIGQEALGPGGVHTGRPYDDYRPSAREFAWALLDAYERLWPKVARDALPELTLVVHPLSFASDDFSEFLARVMELIIAGIPVRFRCDQDMPLLPFSADGVHSREVRAQTVTLNLPRLAYKNLSESEFYRELESTFDVAARAQVSKFRFLQRLFSKAGAGPLSRVCLHRDGQSLIHPDEGRYFIGVSGLDECAQAICGEGLNGDGARFGEEVLGRLQDLVRQWGEDTGLPLSLTSSGSEAVLARLAEMDLSHYGYPAQRVLQERNAYTAGAMFSSVAADEAKSRCCMLSGLSDSEVVFPLPSQASRPEEIKQILEAAFRESDCRTVCFESTGIR